MDIHLLGNATIYFTKKFTFRAKFWKANATNEIMKFQVEEVKCSVTLECPKERGSVTVEKKMKHCQK